MKNRNEDKTSEEVLRILPQRWPFLFVDRIVNLSLDGDHKSIVTAYQVSGEEDFFQGHFPGNPIVPGVILQEAAFQSGALLMGQKETGGGLGVVARVGDAKFKNFVRPGDLLEMHIGLDERLDNAFYMSGKTRVGGKVAMSIRFTGVLLEEKKTLTQTKN